MTEGPPLAAWCVLLVAGGLACNTVVEPPAQPAAVVTLPALPVVMSEGAGQDPGGPAKIAAPATMPPSTRSTSAAARVTDRLDPALARRYREGLAAGRKHTDERDHARAIAGFTAALEAVPEDPRALSGRGHAHLLAGDLDAARADLSQAADRASDPRVAATVHFDLGLVAERRGDVDDAVREFTLANIFRPSSQAAAKIAGKSVCLAKIEEARDLPAPSSTTWLGIWTTYFEPIKANLKDPRRPADELAARDRVCRYEVLSRDACEDASPWLVRIPGPSDDVEVADQIVLIGEQGSGVTLAPITVVHESGACDDVVDAQIVARDPVVVRVTATYSAIGSVCGGKTVDPEVTPGDVADCDEGCVPGRSDTNTWVLSPRTLQPWLTVSTPNRPGDDLPVVAVEVTAAGVTLRGGGCDRGVPRP